MKHTIIAASLLSALALTGCNREVTQEELDSRLANKAQSQFAAGQPIPVFDWSLERQRVIDLYMIRNQEATTHSVWRSNTGMVEGDCPSSGFGIPYDTSLTNPLQLSSRRFQANGGGHYVEGAVEQAEPNGVFASKNTNATWVLCIGVSGALEPVYVESKVTAYPGPVNVDYETNRVTRTGTANFTITR